MSSFSFKMLRDALYSYGIKSNINKDYYELVKEAGDGLYVYSNNVSLHLWDYDIVTGITEIPSCSGVATLVKAHFRVKTEVISGSSSGASISAGYGSVVDLPVNSDWHWVSQETDEDIGSLSKYYQKQYGFVADIDDNYAEAFIYVDAFYIEIEYTPQLPTIEYTEINVLEEPEENLVNIYGYADDSKITRATSFGFEIRKKGTTEIIHTQEETGYDVNTTTPSAGIELGDDILNYATTYEIRFFVGVDVEGIGYSAWEEFTTRLSDVALETVSAEKISAYANIRMRGEILKGGESLLKIGFEYIIQDTEPAEGDSGTEVLEEGEGFDNEEYEIHTGDDLRTLYNLDNDNEDWEATTIWWFRAIGYDNSDNKYYGEWVKNIPEVETGNLNKQLILNSIPTIDAYGNITDKGANEIEQRGFRIIKEYQGDLLGANYYTGINSGYEVMQELEEHSVKDSDGFIIDWYYTVTVYRDILEDSDETGEYNIVLGGGILGDGLIQYLKSNDTYLIQAITDNELGRGFGELKEITTMQGDPLYINVTDIQLSETLFEKTVTFGVTLLNVVRVGIRLGRTIACNELHFFEDGNFGTSGSAKFLVELEPNSTYYIMPYIVVKYGTYEEEIPGMYDWTNPTKKSLYLSKYPPEITDAIEEEDDELYSDLADAGANSGNYSYRKIEREITCEKTGNQGLIDYYGRRRSHTVKNHLIQNKTVCCSVACDYVSKFQTLKLKVVIDTPMLIPFEQEDVILLGNGKTLYRNDGIIAFKETGLGNLEEQPYILAKIRKIDPNYISGYATTDDILNTESVLTIELEV